MGLVKLVTLNDVRFSELDSVNVAVYNVRGGTQARDFDAISFANTLAEHNRNLHWEQIIRVRETSEQVWVFAGMNLRKNSLEAISVFVLEADTVTIINVDGQIDKMLELALSQGRGHRSEARRAG
jgi:hypothetical protein